MYKYHPNAEKQSTKLRRTAHAIINKSKSGAQTNKSLERRAKIHLDSALEDYNAGKPAQLQTLTYTQGNQVYAGLRRGKRYERASNLSTQASEQFAEIDLLKPSRSSLPRDVVQCALLTTYRDNMGVTLTAGNRPIAGGILNPTSLPLIAANRGALADNALARSPQNMRQPALAAAVTAGNQIDGAPLLQNQFAAVPPPIGVWQGNHIFNDVGASLNEFLTSFRDTLRAQAVVHNNNAHFAQHANRVADRIAAAIGAGGFFSNARNNFDQERNNVPTTDAVGNETNDITYSIYINYHLHRCAKVLRDTPKAQIDSFEIEQAIDMAALPLLGNPPPAIYGQARTLLGTLTAAFRSLLYDAGKIIDEAYKNEDTRALFKAALG